MDNTTNIGLLITDLQDLVDQAFAINLPRVAPAREWPAAKQRPTPFADSKNAPCSYEELCPEYAHLATHYVTPDPYAALVAPETESDMERDLR